MVSVLLLVSLDQTSPSMLHSTTTTTSKVLKVRQALMVQLHTTVHHPTHPSMVNLNMVSAHTHQPAHPVDPLSTHLTTDLLTVAHQNSEDPNPTGHHMLPNNTLTILMPSLR